jgi:ribosomal protein S18 acetylase RimI-like enzyme
VRAVEPDSDRRIQVVPLGEDRGDEVAALMGRALQDDPLFVHACPDPGDRGRWLPWMFRWSAWKGFLFGQTLGTAGRLAGVVATIGPGGGEFTEEDLARFGYRRGREAVGAEVWDRAIERVNAAFDPADVALHRAVSEPHWYLDVIAVDPAQQGRGIGGALLRAVHARAAADGAPTVLLTHQPTNLPIYDRHGYVVVCQRTTRSGPRWWGLRRNPGT